MVNGGDKACRGDFTLAGSDVLGSLSDRLGDVGNIPSRGRASL